jgi:hypothetical protein
MMAFDVFISYSSKDKTTADATCASLENAGIRCWIAPRDIRPGSEYGEALVDALDHCRALILIFSASANTSPQIRREVERVVSRGKPVVPLRIEDIAPTKSMAYFVGSVHWLDALTPPLEQHLRVLAEAVKGILNLDSSTEPVAGPAPRAPSAPATAILQPEVAPEGTVGIVSSDRSPSPPTEPPTAASCREGLGGAERTIAGRWAGAGRQTKSPPERRAERCGCPFDPGN